MHRSFKQFLEAITKKDGVISVDYTKNLDGLSTRMGKGVFKPFLATLDGIKTYSLYKVEPGKTDILADLKQQKNIESESYWGFIRRTSVFLSSIIKDEKIDVIITVKSSGKINNDLLQEVQKRFGHIKIVPDAFFKGESLSISDKVDKDSRLYQELTRAISKSNQLKKILPQFRKYIVVDFKLNDADVGMFEGKNVLVLDDILTTGTTFRSVYKTLNDLGSSQLMGISIFKI